MLRLVKLDNWFVYAAYAALATGGKVATTCCCSVGNGFPGSVAVAKGMLLRTEDVRLATCEERDEEAEAMSDWLPSSWFLLLEFRLLLLLPLLEDLLPPPFFGERGSSGKERLMIESGADSEFELESEGRAEMEKSKGWRRTRRVGSVKCIVAVFFGCEIIRG